MTTAIQAVYEGGVFRPTRAVALPEGTQVEVIVPQAGSQHDPRTAARLLAEIAARAPQTHESETASADHDKFLYGPRDES
jgi:predicted DNA-binding antitoxin AbrB/MazE fold protein